MPLRSAPDRPVLSNRRQRQISFRSHLISLNLSSIEVIADVVHFVIRSITHADRHKYRCRRIHVE
jgi:hypothetical protein